MNQQRRSRLHEAGHALCADLLGRAVSQIFVLGGDGHAVHWLPTKSQVDRMTRDEWRRFREALAVIKLAGVAALRRGLEHVVIVRPVSRPYA